MQLNEVLWPNKYPLVAVGLWPINLNTTQSRRYFLYLRYVIAIFTQITLVASHVMTIVLNWGDINVLGDCGSRAVLYSLSTLKMLYYAIRQRSYRLMYGYIKDFWNISHDLKERANYEQFANVAKILSYMSIVAGWSNLISFDVVALISTMNEQHRWLPLNLTYGFNTQSTPIYETIFVWQSFSIACCLCIVVSGDTLMMTLTFHLAGQFRLINHRFRVIGQKINENPLSKDADKELHENIEKCICQHQHVTKVAKELNDFLSPLIFGQIMTSGLEMCLSGFAVIQAHNDTGDFIKFLIFFLTILLQLVIWCWPAEILIRESGEIAKTIYHDIPWFKLTLKQQRDLNIVVLRAQKECHLTALFQVMSIGKLTEVFNAAFAYMALLRNMKN